MAGSSERAPGKELTRCEIPAGNLGWVLNVLRYPSRLLQGQQEGLHRHHTMRRNQGITPGGSLDPYVAPKSFPFPRCKGKGPQAPTGATSESAGIKAPSSPGSEYVSPSPAWKCECRLRRSILCLCLALVNRDDWSLTRGPPAQRSWYPAPARARISKCLCEQDCHYPLCLGTLSGFLQNVQPDFYVIVSPPGLQHAGVALMGQQSLIEQHPGTLKDLSDPLAVPTQSALLLTLRTFAGCAAFNSSIPTALRAFSFCTFPFLFREGVG